MNTGKRILVTGGAGYIGSHMVQLLLQQGYSPIVLDNFSTSSRSNLEYIQNESGTTIEIIDKDITSDLSDLALENIDAIIHFAAWKSVTESVEKPLEYYKNNVYGTINLLQWAQKHSVKKFIFSSSSAVYGDVANSPVTEEVQASPLSPYGRSKLYMESVITDFAQATHSNAVILRYFNVAGNAMDGTIGDQTKDPVAVIPAVICSYLGYKPITFQMYGDTFNTRDGSAVRDFIHVLDLVDAHLKALEYLDQKQGAFTFNLGTKSGTTIKELIAALEKATGEPLNYEVVPARPGEIVVSIADSTKAQQELKWTPKYNISDIVESSLKWYRDTFPSRK
ncbi:MAG: UDP-glucose 4-epimerase GalE [Candidatus Dojkabacteria bacterium]|nr:MAG: UDP-glucose 4-epimerase GalE [Candidatus Dojkabacteria bacterium]